MNDHEPTSNPPAPALPPDPPMPPQPDAAPPRPPSQRFPTWKQAFVLLGGSVLLAASACFGFLFAMDVGGRSELGEYFGYLLAILAIVGLFGIPVGLVLVLMRTLRALFGKTPQAPS